MSDLRILLLTPPDRVQVYGRFEASAPKYPPLGLCYIAAVVERAGFGVRVCDCQAEGIDLAGLERLLAAERPDVVGLTATTVQYNGARQAAALVKRVCPAATTVIGGAHVSATMEQVLREEPALDVGVYGEGEITFLRLVGRLARGASLDGVRGLLTRRGEEVVRSDPRPAIRELDVLPFPALDKLRDLEAYVPPMSRKVGEMTISVVTSRGCPMKCAFCDQAIFGRTWRGHSADYIVAYLQHLRRRHAVDSVTFEDDYFSASRKRVLEVCDALERSGLGLRWGCSIRCDTITDEVLVAMKRAGCVYVYVGIESGSQRVLDMVGKGTTLAGIERAIHHIKRHGLQVIGSAVVGFPTETRAEIEATVRFVLALPLDGLSFFLFTPYPNTETYRMARESGTLREDWDLFSAHPSRLSYVPEGVSERFLLGLQRRVYMRFYLRPRFLLSHLLRPDFFLRAARTLVGSFLPGA